MTCDVLVGNLMFGGDPLDVVYWGGVAVGIQVGALFIASADLEGLRVWVEGAQPWAVDWLRRMGAKVEVEG